MTAGAWPPIPPPVAVADESEEVQYYLSQNLGAGEKNLKLYKLPLNYYLQRMTVGYMMRVGVSIVFPRQFDNTQDVKVQRMLRVSPPSCLKA
jgi:hypothetical protein